MLQSALLADLNYASDDLCKNKNKSHWKKIMNNIQRPLIDLWNDIEHFMILYSLTQIVKTNGKREVFERFIELRDFLVLQLK